MTERFRLAVVLRLREMAEEEARLALGSALLNHRRSVGAAEAEADRAQIERTWLHGLQGLSMTSAGDLQAAVAAVELADRAVDAAALRVEAAAKALLEARARLATATRRREVVERLRDRFVASQRLAAERRETSTLAEIASSRHAWRMIEEAYR